MGFLDNFLSFILVELLKLTTAYLFFISERYENDRIKITQNIS